MEYHFHKTARLCLYTCTDNIDWKTLAVFCSFSMHWQPAASADAQQTVSVVFTTALNLSYVPIFTVKLSLRYLSVVRNRNKMYSLTKSLSLVFDFLVLQTVCSLVFYLAKNNGCCIFYTV